MLLHTDDTLFYLLKNKLLYAETVALGYTPDTPPPVVRFNTSEYVRLLNTPGTPVISIQRTATRGASSDRTYRPTLAGEFFTKATGTALESRRFPQPRNISYQVDIRSPDDAWLAMVEREIDELYSPLHEVNIPHTLFVGETIQVPVRYWFSDATRTGDLQDELKVPMFRSTIQVTAETWLFKRADASVGGKPVGDTMVKSVETTIDTGSSQDIIVEE